MPNAKKNVCHWCGELCEMRMHNHCRHEERRINLETAFVNGEYSNKQLQFKTGSWVKNFILRINDHSCQACGIGEEYNGKPIVLEVNHIDGNALNNIISNVEILCPNCHSQTDSYKAKNKGNGTRKRYGT